MTKEFLYVTNEWVILGVSIVLFILATEAGFRLGAGISKVLASTPNPR